MKRLVEGVSLGVFKAEEIAASIAELREREKDLIVEVASIGEKPPLWNPGKSP